jgi:hypothetical protein
LHLQPVQWLDSVQSSTPSFANLDIICEALGSLIRGPSSFWPEPARTSNIPQGAGRSNKTAEILSERHFKEKHLTNSPEHRWDLLKMPNITLVAKKSEIESDEANDVIQHLDNGIVKLHRFVPTTV